jgi:hypothetical protein
MTASARQRPAFPDPRIVVTAAAAGAGLLALVNEVEQTSLITLGFAAALCVLLWLPQSSVRFFGAAS